MKWHFAASLSVVSTRQGLKSLVNSDNRQGLKSLADSDNRQGLKSLVNSPSPLQWTEYKFLVH
ncbi:hypothetical protein [Microseira sp. BLCC-F43]|uniref:hypothetical protein n=1 Tax=Microseira sp. BLCC-F43 TaxID=3153602 RepID=UPI0035BAEAE6